MITSREKTAKIGNNNPPFEAVRNCLQTDSAIDISTFWCTEEVPSTKPNLKESEMVTKYHNDSTTKLLDGHFQVKFPIKPEAVPFGERKASALRRFPMLENWLEANAKLYQHYR